MVVAVSFVSLTREQVARLIRLQERGNAAITSDIVNDSSSIY